MSTLLLLLACASPSPAPSPTAAPVATTSPFTLVGRASPGGLDIPALPTMQSLVSEQCSALNKALRAKGPPCFVERWSDGATTLYLLRSGDRLSVTPSPGAPVRPRSATWSTLGNVLQACIGDPLSLPPARDGGATRSLDAPSPNAPSPNTGVAGALTLTLSGANTCRLSGTLVLPFDSDRVDASGLAVEGFPWFEGGRERAHGWLIQEGG